MEVISVCNQKGGVAKTTSCGNIGSIIAEQNKKVLLIDLDSQGNLTQSLGVKEYKNTIYNCLRGDLLLKETVVKTKYNNLDIVPADINLANLEGELGSMSEKEVRLKDLIKELDGEYDYILIDCNPALNLLTVNALVASNSILIPMESGIFALQGLGQLIKIVKLIQNGFNKNLFVKGVFLTKVSRTNLTREFLNQLKEIFRAKLLKTYIHQNIDIVKAQIAGKPINHHNKSCKGYEDYYNLTLEVMK